MSACPERWSSQAQLVVDSADISMGTLHLALRVALDVIVQRVLNDFRLEGHKHVEVFLIDERLGNVVRDDVSALAEIGDNDREVEFENHLDFIGKKRIPVTAFASAIFAAQKDDLLGVIEAFAQSAFDGL